MLDKNYRKIRRRALAVIVLFFAGFIMLGVRAFTLQVLDGHIHQKKALSQTTGSIVIHPRRGFIYDREMRILASNQQVPSLVAQPRLMDDEERLIAKTIAKEIFELERKKLKRLDYDKLFVRLKRNLSEQEVKLFKNTIRKMGKESRPLHLNLSNEDKRAYPSGILAAPILGFVNRDLEGKMGLERKFDSDLQGSSQKFSGLIDNSGKLALESLDLSLDVPTGDHLVLTIDKGMQYVTERVIRATVEKYQAAYGIAIVMDVKNSDVLAMGQWPTFDPNDLNKTPMSRLHNYAIEWTFEPGSTMKTFVVAGAIDSARYVPDDKIYCNMGEFQIGPNKIHDTTRHGHLTISDVLAKSSNIGTAKIGMDLGAEKVYEILRSFGFGERSGIRLPVESRGILAKPEDWEPIELATISFGQGVNTTGIQLANAMCAIANGGKLIQPRIVRKVISADGEVKKSFETKIIREVVGENTAMLMREMLKEAASERGTGRKSQMEACQVAGKTGTAEKLFKNQQVGERKYWTSSYAGFFPADDPEIVILVIVDEPAGKKFYGGDVAGPAFKEIAEEVSSMRGVCSTRNQQLAEK